jgi:hypothetical protein
MLPTTDYRVEMLHMAVDLDEKAQANFEERNEKEMRSACLLHEVCGDAFVMQAFRLGAETTMAMTP